VCLSSAATRPLPGAAVVQLRSADSWQRYPLETDSRQGHALTLSLPETSVLWKQKTSCDFKDIFAVWQRYALFGYTSCNPLWTQALSRFRCVDVLARDPAAVAVQTASRGRKANLDNKLRVELHQRPRSGSHPAGSFRDRPQSDFVLRSSRFRYSTHGDLSPVIDRASWRSQQVGASEPTPSSFWERERRL
jgi:hypothetical protein